MSEREREKDREREREREEREREERESNVKKYLPTSSPLVHIPFVGRLNKWNRSLKIIYTDMSNSQEKTKLQA